MNVKQKAKAFEGKIRLILVHDSRLTLGIAEIFGGVSIESMLRFNSTATTLFYHQIRLSKLRIHCGLNLCIYEMLKPVKRY